MRPTTLTDLGEGTWWAFQAQWMCENCRRLGANSALGAQFSESSASDAGVRGGFRIRQNFGLR